MRRLRLCGVLLLVVGCALAPAPARGDEDAHRYKDGEAVKLWVNKVGPYNNPQETYNYFNLPFCKADPAKEDEHSWGGLGEVLQGNELINSELSIRFKGEPCLCVVWRVWLRAAARACGRARW